MLGRLVRHCFASLSLVRFGSGHTRARAEAVYTGGDGGATAGEPPEGGSAGLGEFLPDAKQVSLSEGVRVAGYDYVINTQSASYDLSTGEWTGGGGVRVTGPRVQLSAPYFDLVKNGSLLRLYGGVKARIYPKGTQ